MKKTLILLALIPCLSYGIRQYDWFRVKNWFWGRSFCGTEDITFNKGDVIYIYSLSSCDKFDIYLFDSKGNVRDWYWLARGEDKIADPFYCSFIENRKDNRYK